MITLSAFADEISPDLDEQMAVCRQNGVFCIDVRGIDKQNVSAFTLKKARAYRRRLDDNHFTVPCIGSPIGKIRIGDDFEAHLDLLKHCFEIADAFGTRRIRIFSFYPSSDDQAVTNERDAVLERMSHMVAAAEAADMVLLHENEKAIYGAKPEGVLDLMNRFPGAHFKGIFDPANYVEEGIRPYDQGWLRGLSDLTNAFHVKDKPSGGKNCVPAGTGDGQFAELFADLAQRDWDGYMTLEPHLHSGGQFQGFSGPDLFARAVEALKTLCRTAGLAYR